MTTCAYCGKTFHHHHGGIIFCSDQCRADRARTQQQRKRRQESREIRIIKNRGPGKNSGLPDPGRQPARDPAAKYNVEPERCRVCGKFVNPRYGDHCACSTDMLSSFDGDAVSKHPTHIDLSKPPMHQWGLEAAFREMLP